MDTPIKNTNNIQEKANNKKQVMSLFEARGDSTDAGQKGTKEHFKKLQNKTTWILFGIAIIFLICNLPRIVVKVFYIYLEGRTVQNYYMDCYNANKLHAPAFVHIMSKL